MHENEKGRPDYKEGGRNGEGKTKRGRGWRKGPSGLFVCTEWSRKDIVREGAKERSNDSETGCNGDKTRKIN